ncbi:hypothetical protein TcWFU_006407 [Taenia crassiceps]|uniref:G-protein coupled receptors family 1 profile domain-containing protein n=1 Tax=Taenia crassiceps TaxID=6207 RepID=A0ABR4QBJ0_9CEST
MTTSADMQQALMANRLKAVAMGYMGGPVCVVGIVTSALSLILFKRDTSTTLSTRLLLSAIAVVDIFFLFFMFLLWCVRRFLPQDSLAFRQFDSPTVFGLIFYMSNVFELYRNWLVVVIAVERLLYFLRPIEFKIEGGRINYVSEVLTVIANFGSLVNSTSNFFVYVAQSKRYRYILAKILMLDRCFASLHREPSSARLGHFIHHLCLHFSRANKRAHEHTHASSLMKWIFPLPYMDYGIHELHLWGRIRQAKEDITDWFQAIR